MSGDLFDIDVVRDFMLDRNGKVTNHELVTHFKPFLNDPLNRAVNRVKFKDFVNQLSSVKLDTSGEKVLVLKKKYRDITYFSSKEQPDSKEPRPGGGRPKKARQDKPNDQAGAASLDVTSGSLDSTIDTHTSGSSSGDITGISVDTSLTDPQSSSASSAPKEGGISNMISALYEAAASNMETSAEQISATTVTQEESEEITTGDDTTQRESEEQDVTLNETAQDNITQEESVLDDTSQICDESITEHRSNSSEVASSIPEYSPEEEKKDIDSRQEIGAASSDHQTLTEESESNDTLVIEPVSVKDRAKHLNKMTSDTDVRNVTASFVNSPPDQSDRNDDDDNHSTISGEMVSDTYMSSRESSEPRSANIVGVTSAAQYVLLEQDEKEWMVLCSTADYHPMNKMLLKNKSLAKFKDFLSTALHWAAKRGKPEVVKLLCATNLVNVNARSGYTPLHLAAMHGHEDVLELLVNTYSANSNLRDYSGKKPKQYLKHSASSRAHQILQTRKASSSTESIAFRRVGSYSDKIHKSGYFGIQVSPAMRNSWVTNNNTPADSLDVDKPSPKSRSPSRSPSWSPHIRRKGSHGAHDIDRMPPPQGMPPKRTKSKKKFSKDKENDYNGSGSRTGSESDLNLQGQTNYESVV